MRILHLTPELPYAPGGSGGSTRQFQLLRRLVERGSEVTVVSPVHPSQAEGPAYLREAGIELFAVNRPSSRVRETGRALATRPGLMPGIAREPLLAWQVDVFWTRLRRAHEAAVAARTPDVITVEHDWSAGWHTALPPRVPRVLTLHNVTGDYYAARARSRGGLAGRALALEGRRFARYDRAHLNAYDLLVAMSEPDRAAIRRLTGTRCEVVPNGVDTTAPAPPPPSPEADPVLLYTGTMSYPPNHEGLRWLLREVWPRIRGEAPRARLLVVGRDPAPAAVALGDDRVEFAGWVPSLAPAFARASVVLVPILSGGGTRLKVLDGLASGRPLVSTRVGAAGIDARDAEHVLLADDPGAFAAAVLRLLADPPLRERVGREGRVLVEQCYDWRPLGDRLDGLLREVVDAAGA